jgi:hypothetical protein
VVGFAGFCLFYQLSFLFFLRLVGFPWLVGPVGWLVGLAFLLFFVVVSLDG